MAWVSITALSTLFRGMSKAIIIQTTIRIAAIIWGFLCRSITVHIPHSVRSTA